MNNCEEMKPIYSFDKEKTCGVIHYNGRIYHMDMDDRDKIINFNKRFMFNNKDDMYPSYNYNEQVVNYLTFIYKFKEINVKYTFNNNNPYDLRRCNVKYYHVFHETMTQNFNIIEYISGHYADNGRDAYHMKNPMWKVNEYGKEILLMYCEKDTLIKICPIALDKIREYEKNHNNNNKNTFFIHHNGYICSTNSLYIHQIIKGCYGNGKGTKNISVDHIDQDPLNNTWENLKIASRKEQEQNCNGIKEGTKRERKHNAQELPDGITQESMRKYVCYYKDYADKDKTILREYFRIETHPKMNKLWSTSKSCKISIHEKLAQANKVIDDLENNIYPEVKEETLPTYISLIMFREKPHLVFDRKVDGKRLNLKMVLPQDYDLQDQLKILSEKIKTKYELTIDC